MLCNSITEKEFEKMDLSNFLAELKEDGERIIAVKEGLQIWLYNRRGREKSAIYSELVRELEKLELDFVIDAEVITCDELFNSLQHRSNLSDRNKIKEAEKKYPIKLMVFDIISLNKLDLRNKSLIERKKYLECLRGLEKIEVLNWFEGEDIRKLWEYVKENNKEGIILKLKNSVYEYRRSNSWIKLKNFKEVEVSFSRYESNNAGVKLISQEVEVQVQADSSSRVEKIKEKINNGGEVRVLVQYLSKGESGRLRFPSCRSVLI